MALALAGVLWTGAGDIYRCVDSAGDVRFSDLPCAESSDQLPAEAGYADDPAVLRRWLGELQQVEPKPRQPPVSGTPRRRPEPPQVVPGLPARPTGQSQFRQCSAQFFGCASGDDRQMDTCVFEIPVCTGDRRVGCCPDAYVERYRRLREAGLGRQPAVRDALLGRHD